MPKSESLIQQEIVCWFRKNYYKKGVIFSVPNERDVSYAELRKLLLTGLLPGVSDLVVILENKVIFVEVKNEKGKQSEKQKKFQESVENYFLVRSLDEFKKILLHLHL